MSRLLVPEWRRLKVVVVVGKWGWGTRGVKRQQWRSWNTQTSGHCWRFLKVFVFDWLKKRLEPARIVSGLSVEVKRSRLNLLGDDGEDDVLVAPPHHSPQRLVPLDGDAHVSGRSDRFAVNADDDITLPEAGSVAAEIRGEGKKQKKCQLLSSSLLNDNMTLVLSLVMFGLSDSVSNRSDIDI